MPKLKDNVKQHIVTQLACYETPTDVANSVREEFGIEITRGQAHSYDPNSSRGHQLAQKWKDLFKVTREAFLEDTSAIPVANKAVRLKRLQRMADKAEQMRNYQLASQLLEQVAKECGGSYTNKRELSGPNGSAIPTETEVRVRYIRPEHRDE